ELRRTAISRLGKQVIEMVDVTGRFGDRTVIDRLTWHIGPGDRFGILGENGSGKTTLLNIIRGSLEPTSGHVKIGKTVKFAFLSQHLSELNELEGQRVREVLTRYHTRYEFDGRELTPAQLLERLGFEAAHLSAYISDLSGGQKRRLQLMLILLDRPNVLILDEPDNDLDIDMLAVVESLLDTWPGTLLLITHDRHLMERVTDDQFALLDGKIQHVPGGLDEYLRLIDGRTDARPGTATSAQTSAAGSTPGSGQRDDRAPMLSSAETRALKKELAATERKLNTLGQRLAAIRDEMREADPSDYVALGDIQGRIQSAEQEISDLENEWVEISERLA
ncbi:MAG: ATP-binding cassette domain-containing protein, partial [Coriobacteriia bacterium]